MIRFIFDSLESSGGYIRSMNEISTLGQNDKPFYDFIFLSTNRNSHTNLLQLCCVVINSNRQHGFVFCELTINSKVCVLFNGFLGIQNLV